MTRSSSRRNSTFRATDAPTPASPPPFARLEPWLRRCVALAVALAIGVLCATTFGPRSDGVVLGNDVLNYADEMRGARGGMLWNPHHLGVHACAAALFRVLRWLGEPASFATAWRAQQLVACAGSAWCVYSIVDLVSEASGVARGALVGLLFGVSAGNWLYAASGETYLPGTAACLALVVLVVRMRLGLANEGWIAPALWLCGACLMRQDSVLVVPVLFVLLPWSVALRATLAAGAVTLAAYAAAWSASSSSLAFGTWLRGLAESGEWGRAPGFTELGETLGLTLAALAWITWDALVLGLAVLVLVLVLSTLVPPRRLVGEFPRVLVALAVWALVRGAFFAWWQAGNLEYHTGTLAPLALAFGLALRPFAFTSRARSWGSARPTSSTSSTGSASSTTSSSPFHSSSAPRRLPLAALWMPLRQLVVLALAGVLLYQTNGARLLWPNRAELIAHRLDMAFALAGPNGSVIALDSLTGKALLRSRVEGVEVLDAGAAAGGLPPDTTAPAPIAAERARLLAHVRDVLARGAGVVAVVDWVMPLRLGKPLWNLDLGFVAELQALGDAQQLKDADGHVWAVALRAR